VDFGGRELSINILHGSALLRAPCNQRRISFSVSRSIFPTRGLAALDDNMPLKPAVSAQARHTIKTAFDQLDGTILPDDSREFSATTLEDVRKTALGIENQLAARKSLRNMRRLLPLFNGLEHYAKVVDILCNGTPYLSWVWAPITLILRIASEYVEAFEKITKGYARIAESLSRFQVLSQALKRNLSFQDTLAAFYADILQFHKHAYEFVRRKSRLSSACF
jgi:hypothetical protein